MVETPEPTDPPRPLPDRRPIDALTAWWAWIGPTRVIATAVCVAVLVAGGWWLVRSPAPATEATLPMASSGTATGPPIATLAPPVTIPTGSEPIDLVVHVAGRVVAPGVYAFDRVPRVHDAIERAGGASDDADLDALNLALPLTDGQRLYVPALGEVDAGAVLVPEPPAGTDDGAAEDAPAGPIDLNRASADELERLPGVGPATAAAIVDDRDRNGPFATIDELDRVPGIGPAKLAALRDLVSV